MLTFDQHLANVHAARPALDCGQPLTTHELHELLWETWEAATLAATERLQCLRLSRDHENLQPAPLEATLALSEQVLDNLRAHQTS